MSEWTTLRPAVIEDVFSANEEGFWQLVRFEAEHEPERVDYYAQLEGIERERQRRERLERLKTLPRPGPGRLTLSAALERLERVRPAGEGRWTALCPVHGDHLPSLVVEERRERPEEPHFHCYAGCDWRSILAELKR